MYVTIRIHITPHTPLLEIPEEGLRPGNKVWCVRGGKLTIVPVNFVTMIDRMDDDGSSSRHALVYVNDPGPSSDGAAFTRARNDGKSLVETFTVRPASRR